jgi:hypothetical protein
MSSVKSIRRVTRATANALPVADIAARASAVRRERREFAISRRRGGVQAESAPHRQTIDLRTQNALARGREREEKERKRKKRAARRDRAALYATPASNV